MENFNPRAFRLRGALLPPAPPPRYNARRPMVCDPPSNLARRRFLLQSLAAGFGHRFASFFNFKYASTDPMTSPSARHIAVVGAGAFGGWTALELRRRGARVTLLDAWGPGNSRASSGGESRIIRGTYGPDAIYTRMVARALQLWRENEKRWNLRLYHPIGVIWLANKDDKFEKAALAALRSAGLAFDQWTTAEAARHYPQINFEGAAWVIHEKDAGYLLARRACEAVMQSFVAEGGEYRQLAVELGDIKGGELQGIRLSDRSTLKADHYVFACGPWLPKVFPAVIGDHIRPTRQEVYFFGTPAGDPRYTDQQLPVWIDNGDRLFYGIPGNQWRGIKVANDTRGPLFDPTTGEREPTPSGIKEARDYLAFRFPGLKNAPLIEARVCQYENAPDNHFIIDRHPQAGNLWIVGGGSGHGYKHGPAVGEIVSQAILDGKPPDPMFSLKRLQKI